MTEYAGYQFRMGKEFGHVLSKRSPLENHEQNLCVAAIYRFRDNPYHPGLNFEALNGPEGGNLYSIRSNRDLRVILAIDEERQICVLANAGHHDIYEGWVANRGCYYSPDMAKPMRESVREAHTLDAFHEALHEAWDSDFNQWIEFLLPQEEHRIRERWPGAAHIRGPAGTGKTVAALRRAAVLAARYSDERILLTAPHRALCHYLRMLYRRLPEARDNVEFVHLDDLALALCGGIAAGRWVNQTQVDAAFEAAYQRVVTDTALAQLGRTYLREEIEMVIKGRGVQRAADYLDTDNFQRLGRKCSFPLAIRAQVWALHEAWNNEMQVRRTVHRGDNARLGRDNAGRLSRGIYRCAIVDEAQDMSLVSMQLLRALVAGSPENPVPEDGILLLDDEAQRFYAGRFQLSWADLNVKGRSFSLDIHYRNTQRIIEAAREVRGHDLLVRENGLDNVEPRYYKEGHKPRLIRVADTAGENQFLRDEIRKLTQDEGYKPEEIGVLVRDSQAAVDIRTFLEDESGFSCTQLGQPTRKYTVQVDTFAACKGFEFRAVFIPRLANAGFPRLLPVLDDPDTGGAGKGKIGAEKRKAVIEESRQLELNHLSAAMTRAREYLVLITSGDLCPEIQAARHRFNCQDLSPLYAATSP